MSLSRRHLLLGSAAWAAAVPQRARAVAPASSPAEPNAVCIVGSGFAGTFLALRLVQSGIPVLILEAGPPALDAGDRDGAQDLFPVRYSGPLDYRIRETRTIAAGGTSRKWSGLVTRLLPDDLRLRSLYDLEADWPIRYADLEPYYCEAESLLHTAGPSVRAGGPRGPCAGEGSRPNQPPLVFEIDGRPLEFAPIALSVRRGKGRPIRLLDVEIPQLRTASLATFRPQTRVVRLLSERPGRIEHIELDAGHERTERIAIRECVLAAGALETARILLASRSHIYPHGPGNQARHVGRHYNEHPRFDLELAVDPGFPIESGFHRTYGLVADFARRHLNPSHLQIEVHPRENGRVVNVSFQPQLEAASGNRLWLDEPGNHTRPAHARLDFNYTERDRRTIARGLVLRDELVRALGHAPKSAHTRTRWQRHPAGTCRMAADPQEGVVDPDLRVFGVENLYALGSCVFPCAGTGNPTLTVVALALRLADHLIARRSHIQP